MRKRFVRVARSAAGFVAGAVLAATGASAGDGPALAPAQADLVARAKALGATDVATRPAPNGGFVLGGRLEGRQFAVAFPRNWNRGALLFLHGYTTPGTPVTVAEDPLSKAVGDVGILQDAYGDGYAAGQTAYDKAGMGVQSATVNTMRLRDFLTRLGTRRTLLAGASMGGNVVLSLIEQHPRAFAGAISACGVTDGWESQFGALTDMRAAYEFLTRGTPYALPGWRELDRSALPAEPPAGDRTSPEAFRLTQAFRIASPVLALFRAAEADPSGREARIIRQVASIGAFEPERASFAFPLLTAALGEDDLRATLGGNVYGNVGKVYASPEFGPGEADAFNKGVQRLTADPAAVANARRWHQATGRFAVPLVTVHNRIDSLVPYAQSLSLGRIVAKAGNSRLLAQYVVPGVKVPLPVPGGLTGYAHCGFSPEQTASAWRALRLWVETGRRPAADAVR